MMHQNQASQFGAEEENRRAYQGRQDPVLLILDPALRVLRVPYAVSRLGPVLELVVRFPRGCAPGAGGEFQCLRGPAGLLADPGETVRRTTRLDAD